MLRLKNRNVSAINAFQYRQPETGVLFTDWSFESLVTQVIQHRKQNPRFNFSTDANAVRQEVDYDNALRMMKYRGGESYVIVDAGVAPAPKRVALHNALQNVVGGIKKAWSGKAALTEWLGEGGEPVRGELANNRAAKCAVCPKNQPGDWTAFFTEPAADLIRHKLELRHNLNLSTPYDDKLIVCEACTCPLKLKVHTPLKHILAHTPDDVRAELDAGCWILSEEKNEH